MHVLITEEDWGGHKEALGEGLAMGGRQLEGGEEETKRSENQERELGKLGGRSGGGPFSAALNHGKTSKKGRSLIRVVHRLWMGGGGCLILHPHPSFIPLFSTVSTQPLRAAGRKGGTKGKTDRRRLPGSEPAGFLFSESARRRPLCRRLGSIGSTAQRCKKKKGAVVTNQTGLIEPRRAVARKQTRV